MRRYPLPHELLGRCVWLVSTRGAEGVATLGDAVRLGQPDAQLVRARLC